MPPNRADRDWITSWIPTAVGTFAFVGGLLSLIGWVLAVPRFIDWINEGIGIKVNTSICIMAAGLGLFFSQRPHRWRWLIRTAGALVTIVAGLTLWQHISGVALGIDTLLYTEPEGARATTSPGRMGLPASTSLTMIGLGLVLLTFERFRSWTPVLGITALIISSLSLVGYIFGASQFYAIPRFTGIALQTALMLAAIGLGLVTVVPQYGIVASMSRGDAGGTVLRRLFIPLVLISLTFGWLRLTGQNLGLYDTAFGTAMGTLVEMALLLGLLWWTANDLSASESRVRAANRALTERDERMQGVLEALSDAFVSFDSDFRFTHINPAAQRLFANNSLTGPDLIGMSVFETFPETRDTVLGQLLVRTMTERVPADREEYYPPLDRWFHARYLPSDDGGLSIFALDITERKLAEETVLRRAHELTVLYAFADSLNRSGSLSEVYEGALDAITRGLGCNRASILLFNDSGVMSFVAARGLSADYQKAVEGHSPWKQGETDAAPLSINDVTAADIEPDVLSAIKAEGIGSLGFIPLISNETLIGKFMVYYDEPHEFSEAELEIASTIGYQIAFGVERKRTEQTLRENEERLRLATQTGGVGVWDWDVSANRVTWTEPVYEMHGVTPGNFGGGVEDFASFVHPDDREFVQERIQMALAGEAPYDIEFRVIQPGGDIRWLYTNALVLRDESGPYRMIGATMDVTGRKTAEQELATLAAIVDSSADAIISKDLDGIIRSWNHGAERLFGYSSDEAVGKPVMMLIPEDRQFEETEILARIRQGDYVDHYETVRCKKDGTLFDISLTVSPVFDPDGKVTGASKIARDITQRRQTEMAIRDREIMHRLVEAQEAERNRIARDLHDHLGQQLTALRLKLEAIRSKCTENDDLAGDVEATQEYAARIDMDINYLAWELRPTELDQLGLQDALASFVREWSKTYGIAAEFHASAKNTERLHPELETNLYRILQEALNNILKHADASSVNVLLERRNDRIGLIIEDNGRGFESERRSESSNGSKGLGLVGMRERTALLGGTLEIESRPGEGTTLYARVPVRVAEEDVNGNGGG